MKKKDENLLEDLICPFWDVVPADMAETLTAGIPKFKRLSTTIRFRRIAESDTSKRKLLILLFYLVGPFWLSQFLRLHSI